MIDGPSESVIMEMQESPQKGQPEARSGQPFIEPIISQPTAFTPVYPFYESPLNPQPLHLISPPPISSSVVRKQQQQQQQLHSCINCYLPGSCLARLIIQTFTSSQLITSSCSEQLTTAHLLYRLPGGGTPSEPEEKTERLRLGRNKEEERRREARGWAEDHFVVIQREINANEWLGSCNVVIRKRPAEEDAAGYGLRARVCYR